MASVPAIKDKGSSYVMESLRSCLHSERWKGRELRLKTEKEEGDWGRGSPFPFRAFLPLPLTGLFCASLKGYWVCAIQLHCAQRKYTTRLLSPRTLDQSYNPIYFRTLQKKVARKFTDLRRSYILSVFAKIKEIFRWEVMNRFFFT